MNPLSFLARRWAAADQSQVVLSAIGAVLLSYAAWYGWTRTEATAPTTATSSALLLTGLAAIVAVNAVGSFIAPNVGVMMPGPDGEPLDGERVVIEYAPTDFRVVWRDDGDGPTGWTGDPSERWFDQPRGVPRSWAAVTHGATHVYGLVDGPDLDAPSEVSR